MTAQRRRLIKTIDHPDQTIVFKLYRDYLLQSHAVLVTPATPKDFEPFWLDNSNDWPDKADAIEAINKAIQSGDGL